MARNKYCTVGNENVIRLDVARKGLMKIQYIPMYYTTSTNQENCRLVLIHPVLMLYNSVHTHFLTPASRSPGRDQHKPPSLCSGSDPESSVLKLKRETIRIHLRQGKVQVWGDAMKMLQHYPINLKLAAYRSSPTGPLQHLTISSQHPTFVKNCTVTGPVEGPCQRYKGDETPS